MHSAAAGCNYQWDIALTKVSAQMAESKRDGLTLGCAQTGSIAVILTALEVETRAVLRHIECSGTETVRGTVFHLGKFSGWTIATAELGAGNASAAAITERAVERFEPNVALFVGVAGGIKDVAIGDVVVATKVYGYESGKDTERGFKTRPTLQSTSHTLEQRARALRLGIAWQQRLPKNLRNKALRVHVGPIAAGEKVVADLHGPVASFLREHYGDALAVEMEGRGFLEGVHLNESLLGCVIRGISDLLSGKRNADAAGSQEYASATASAVAFELLRTLPIGRAHRISAPDEIAPSGRPIDWNTPPTAPEETIGIARKLLGRVLRMVVVVFGIALTTWLLIGSVLPGFVDERPSVAAFTAFLWGAIVAIAVEVALHLRRRLKSPSDWYRT